MGYVALALLSGVLLGVWKFGLSVYRGRVSGYATVLVSASAAALGYVVIGSMMGSLAFDRRDVFAGFLGGACNLAGTLLLLEGYRRGKVGVVTGIAASCVLIPLAYSFAIGEPLSREKAVGVVVILSGMAAFYVGSMRVGREDPAVQPRTALLFALGAALFWGVAIIVLDRGTLVSLTGALTMSQVPQVTFTAAMVLLAKGSRAGVTGRAVAVIAAAGIALALGNMAYFTAANEGDIGVVSVLGSLSPLVTALLAVAILRERMSRVEWLALGVVLAGTALVAR